jgi:putative phosphonate metabolism protein
MKNYSRYAAYFAPRPGPLAEFADAWLGWSATDGREVAHPDIPGLPAPVSDLTATPRKYGFHGTLKPPFRIVEGRGRQDLEAAVHALSQTQPPVVMPSLRLARLGGFLALVPEGDTTDLAAFAATVVKELDGFRAPAGEAELARRRAAGLTPAQEAHLRAWGYPYVLSEFKFHLTLTGQLPTDDAERVRAALAPVMEPRLPQPFVVEDLCLFGEAEDGWFHLLHRYALTG